MLSGCKVDPESSSNKVTAIIGAVLIDGNGGPPITDSVVVVAGSRIRTAGLRANVAIPADASKINGSGKFLVPGLIDTYVEVGRKLGAPGVTTTRVVDAAHEPSVSTNVAPADYLFIREDIARDRADAILDESRKYNIPVTAGVTTLARAQQLVKSGAAGLVGMISDTEDIDQTRSNSSLLISVGWNCGSAAISSSVGTGFSPSSVERTCSEESAKPILPHLGKTPSNVGPLAFRPISPPSWLHTCVPADITSKPSP